MNLPVNNLGVDKLPHLNRVDLDGQPRPQPAQHLQLPDYPAARLVLRHGEDGVGVAEAEHAVRPPDVNVEDVK